MIKVVQGFKLSTREAVDNRLLLSKTEMKSINDNQMPEKYFAICKDDGTLYLYDKSRVLTGSEETGKFVQFTSGNIQSITINGEEVPIVDKTVDLPLMSKTAFGLAKAGQGVEVADGVISLDFNAVDDKSISYKKVNFEGASINGGNTSVIEDEIKTRVRLWEDSDVNFESIKDTLIPLQGELLIVTFDNGDIRFKVGDGKTTYANLKFSDQVLRDQVNGIIVKGYFYEGEFYVDEKHVVKIVPAVNKLFIDIPTSNLYQYSDLDGEYHLVVNCTCPDASPTVAGIMKLYDDTGENIDGTMTQRSITSEIAKKFVVSAGDDEDLIFTANV